MITAVRRAQVHRVLAATTETWWDPLGAVTSDSRAQGKLERGTGAPTVSQLTVVRRKGPGREGPWESPGEK